MNGLSADQSNVIYRLWSVIAFGPGTAALGKLCGEYDTAEDIYTAVTQGGVQQEFSAGVIKKAEETPLSAAERVYDYCLKRGIGIVTIDDDLYPERLKKIDIPPALLFYRGDISGINDRLNISIVGARKPTEYSLRVTAGIVRVLSRLGFDIISGFATGIDICSHKAAVDSHGRTFAVLGAGIDHNYPKENFYMRDSIIENGALITEYLPETTPYPANFPQRNRILSGIAMSAAVIEANDKSGSLNTATHAAEQGKTVFVVPPCDLFSKKYLGNIRLMREGAVPLMGISDIIGEYCSGMQHTINESDSLSQALDKLREFGDSKAKEEAKKSVKNKKRTDSRTEAPAEPVKQESAALSGSDIASLAQDDVQLKILTALNGGLPMRADDIAAGADEDIGSILAALTELEIMGTVTVENGCYSL